MKKYISLTFFTLLFAASTACAQTGPVLFDEGGAVIDVYNQETNALTPGWYYDENGSPLYYYANGVAYDPLTQSYMGSVVYPYAAGPETLTFTPGVPNTGAGGTALTALLALILSGSIAVAGTYYLTRPNV